MNDHSQTNQKVNPDRHWRWQSRKAIALEQIRRLGFDGKRSVDILDIGFGQFNLASELSAIGDVDAVDLNANGQMAVSKRSRRREIGKRYDLVVAMDIIGRVDDDTEAIAEMCTLLRPGGKLLISAAAHQILANKSDVFDAGRKRYSLHKLKTILRAFGEVRRIRYIHGLTLPGDLANAILRRQDLRSSRLLNDKANQVLSDMLIAEYKATRYLPLLSGSAIMAVLNKPIQVRSRRVVMQPQPNMAQPMLRAAA